MDGVASRRVRTRTRRAVLTVVAGGLTAGCLSGDGNEARTPTAGRGTAVEGCDPGDVDRPPVVEDAGHPPKGYGTKPQELADRSVADYLADFETAFAWNRILEEHAPVASLSVDTTTPWTPESAGDGFLASSRIETGYAREAGSEPVERAYVASYYVSAGPVYRVETNGEPVDPRTRADRRLVQCGEDAGK